jgi:hypothetical protein
VGDAKMTETIETTATTDDEIGMMTTGEARTDLLMVITTDMTETKETTTTMKDDIIPIILIPKQTALTKNTTKTKTNTMTKKEDRLEAEGIETETEIAIETVMMIETDIGLTTMIEVQEIDTIEIGTTETGLIETDTIGRLMMIPTGKEGRCMTGTMKNTLDDTTDMAGGMMVTAMEGTEGPPMMTDTTGLRTMMGMEDMVQALEEDLMTG